MASPARVVNVRGLTGEARRGVVYVGRGCAGWPPHQLSNPYRLESWPDRAACLAAYREYLSGRPNLAADLAALWATTDAGRLPLGCWCCDWDGASQPAPLCHAVVLAQLLNRRFGGSHS